jgi:hypothetical protein
MRSGRRIGPVGSTLQFGLNVKKSNARTVRLVVGLLAFASFSPFLIGPRYCLLKVCLNSSCTAAYFFKQLRLSMLEVMMNVRCCSRWYLFISGVIEVIELKLCEFVKKKRIYI